MTQHHPLTDEIIIELIGDRNLFYCLAETVAIRPMTNRGADLIAGLAANGDDLHEAFAGSTGEEMRCSLRDFDEHFYEMLIDMGYGLNVKRAPKTND